MGCTIVGRCYHCPKLEKITHHSAFFNRPWWPEQRTSKYQLKSCIHGQRLSLPRNLFVSSLSDQWTEQRACRCRLHRALRRFRIRFLGGEYSRRIGLSPRIHRKSHQSKLIQKGRSAGQLRPMYTRLVVSLSRKVCWTRMSARPMLIFLQILSGKQPWSKSGKTRSSWCACGRDTSPADQSHER